jgi:Galactose oxidase-like, Early set domain/Bacterial Ig domain/Glyoxal oxidase N-terminus/Fibronectin type III domain/Kelch motif
MFLASYRQLVYRVVLPAIILITVVPAVESGGQQRESHSRLKSSRGETSAFVSYEGGPRSVSAGLLNGSFSATPATVNLTTEGTTDWTHWGLNLPNDFDHKAGVTQKISNCTIIGPANLYQYNDNPSGYTWLDGTPTGGATNTTTGIFVAGVGNGFQFTVPADTTSKTLKLYVGLWKATGKLEVSLSDGSAPAFTDTSLNNSSATSIGVYTINFQAASNGQVLTIKYTALNVYDPQWGNVTLQAATLSSGATGNIPPSVNITSPADGSTFMAPANITISATASDSDGTVSKVDFYQGANPIGTATTAPYSATWSNVAAGSYTITAVATDNSGTTTTSTPVNVTVTGTSQQIGAWSSIIPLPIVAIHMHMLPNGKVLIWQDDNNPSYNINGSRGPGLTVAYVWDVSAGTFTEIDDTTDNVFCSGHAFLPDGRLLVTGGHISDSVGIRTTTIFDFRSNTWSIGSTMNAGRWYPTTTSLANGEVLVVSGDIDTTQGVNTLPQVWRTTGGWRSLTTALRSLPLYPMMHLAPNGMVFNSGPNQNTSYLNTTGTGAWLAVANRNFGFRDYGSSVMYDDGKVLAVGGGDPPTNTAEVIDLNATTPSWRNVASMVYARRQLNSTLLPDGTVLVTGGTSSSGFNDGTNAVLAAELWDPSTEQWTRMASMQNRRVYHSTAIVLTDGRVLSAGGGRPAATGDTDHLDAEIYSPPYLFKGARPSISSAPDNISYGQTFFVQTPDAGTITKATLLKLSSVTHAFNMEQRINRLNFSAVSNGLNIVAPSNANLCPPGYYMLFILNSSGVPSVAKIVRVDAATVPVPAPPSTLTATAPSSSQINLSWTDNSNNEDGFRIEQCQGAGCTNFAEIATVGANVVNYSNTGLTASTTYQYRVRAYNSGGNSAYSNIASATTSPPTAPMAPLNLTATAPSSSQINLSWTDNSNNEDGFRIEQCQGAGCTNFAEIATVGANVVNYSNTGLTALTTYQYRVRAYNGGGNSAYSNIAAGTTSTPPPLAPSNLTATVLSSSQIQLAWTDNSNNEAGFKIERCSSPNCQDFSEVVAVAANVTSYTDTGLKSNRTYRYRVRSYNAGGNSLYSNIANATIRK